MAAHGGMFRNYIQKDVTHIICSNLPDSKVKHLENVKERDPKPILLPEWVTDSLEAGQLLPVENYSLWRLRDKPGQKSLTGFAAQNFSRSTADESAPAALWTDSAGAQPDVSALETGFRKKVLSLDFASISDAFAGKEAVEQQADPPAANLHLRPRESLHRLVAMARQFPSRQAAEHTVAAEAPQQGAANSEAAAKQDVRIPVSRDDCDTSLAGVHAQGYSSHMNAAGEAGSAAEQEIARASGDGAAGRSGSMPGQRLQTATSAGTAHVLTLNQKGGSEQASGGCDTSLQAAQQIAAQARQKCDMLKGPPRSSREDPAFQANYFAASRLHFIGSWKARIEALAASMANTAPKACPPARGSTRAIIHIDMDCFFASVAALGEPALQGKALCVSHSASSKGAGEVSSANYEARAFGVRAGMFISEAKRLCPDIIVMPYMFEKYEAISEKVYRILMEQTSSVQPLSCDEAFMDVTGLGDPELMVGELRAKIQAETGCTASAGIGPNMLLARLATKRAKPNGLFHINSVQADEELLKLSAEDLPGVGWAMREKLKALGITTVADVRNSRLTTLQHELGTKSGTLVWDYAHGRDDRVVATSQARKSVGAEINYAVRLDTVGDVDKFVDELAGELADRMLKAGVKGRTLTLKVKRKKTGAPEPIKFLGHGICDNHSRSVTLPRFVGTRTVLAKTGKELLRAMNIPAPEIRGLGLTMTKLDNDPTSALARPSAPAPAKGAIPAASHYDPNAPNPFAAFYEIPAVKAAMPPQKERPDGSEAPRSAAGHSPRTFHGPLHGLLLRQGSCDGPADSCMAEPPVKGLDTAVEEVGSEHAAYQGHVSCAATAAAADTTRCLGVESTPPAYHPGTSVPCDRSSGMSGAGSLDEADAAGLDSDGDIGQEASVSELSQRDLGQGEVDMDIGSQSEGVCEGKQAAAARVAPSNGNADGVSDVSLSQMDAAVWSELPPEVQQHLLQGASGRQHLPEPMDNTKEAAKGTPIQALPPASQIDVAVLDALPLELKRELERAYGVGVVRTPPHKRKRGGAIALAGRVVKRQRPLTEAFQSPPKARVAVGGLTMTQVDPAVLAELPPELVAELVARLPPSHEPFAKQGNLSPDASQPESGSHAAHASGAQPSAAGRSGGSKRLRQKQLGPAEDVRQVWSALSFVLEDLWQSYSIRAAQSGLASGSESPGSSEAPGDNRAGAMSESLSRLDAVCEVVREWGCSLVPTDLESLQYLLTRLKAASLHWEQFSARLDQLSMALQEAVQEEYKGRIALK